MKEITEANLDWLEFLWEWGNIIFNPIGYLIHIRENY